MGRKSPLVSPRAFRPAASIRRPRLPASGGFTILEVLLASVILAMIGTLSYAALFGTFRTQKIIDEKSEIQEDGTSILSKIRDDISQTFHVASSSPKTQFLGEDSKGQDRVTFTALAHYPSQADARESDQCEVTYRVGESGTVPGTFLLQRKESPYFWNIRKTDDKTGFVTLASNVVSFDLEYGDGQKFVNAWNIQSRETPNQLPRLVRISLVLRDEQGREETFETTADLPMAENLGMAAGVQGGTQTNPNANQPGQRTDPSQRGSR